MSIRPRTVRLERLARLARFAFGVVLVGVIGACGESIEERASTPAADPAPGFELERLGGGRVALDEYRGKLLLIDFWATWCAPCVLEIPELNALYAAERANGFELLAISVDAPGSVDLEEWTREQGVDYPVAVGSEVLAREYGAFAFPFHVLVGPDGSVLKKLEPGYHDREELGELLAQHR